MGFLDSFYKLLRIEQYGDDPVTQQSARTLVNITLLSFPIGVVVTLSAIFVSPASDLPGDLAFIVAMFVAAFGSWYFIRSSQIERALLWFGFFSTIAASGQILYPPPSFAGLTFYWVNAFYIGFFLKRRIQVVVLLSMITALWTWSFLFDSAPGTSIDSLAYRLAILWIIGLGSSVYVSTIQVFATQAGREEAEAESRQRINMMQISREVVASTFARRDLQEVLDRAIEDIRQRYTQVYHAQVFLVNKETNYAELRASTGKVGQELIEREHKLAVGSQSVIGQVTLTKQMVKAISDVTDTVHKRNELLRETKTELALPLLIGNEVIGVLDLQSTERDAFSEDDIEVFQALANQIAVAINNAALIEQIQEQSDEAARLFNAERRNRELIESYNRELTQQAWDEITAINEPLQLNISTGDTQIIDEISPRALAVFENGDLVIERETDDLYYVLLPVQVYDNVVSVLEFEVVKAELPDEQTTGILRILADRIGRVAENQRLFQQTQQALTESERLYQMAQSVNAAGNATIDDVYGIVADQLVYEPQLDTMAVLLAEPAPSFYTSHLEIAYILERNEKDIAWQRGQQLDYLRRGFTSYFESSPDRLLYFGEKPIARSPEEQVTEDIMTALDAESLLMTPIVLGDKWFGILVCASGRRNAFQQRFHSFSQAAATQLALSIDNRRLFVEAQKEAQRAFVLAETGQQVAALRGDVQTRIGRLFQALAGPAEFDYWWLGTLAEGNDIVNVLETSTSTDSTVELPTSISLSQDDNSIVESIQVNQVILVNEPDNSESMLYSWKSQFGKHVVVPISTQGDNVMGALLLGRQAEARDFDERDVQFVTTFATQLAIAFENQSLFIQAENQRRVLDEILAFLPTGVIVFDADGDVSRVNDQARTILGEGIQAGLFSPGTYPIYDSTNDTPYSVDNFPALLSIKSGESAAGQTFYVVKSDAHRIDVLLNSATIHDNAGNINSTVMTLQDISELRELEAALQSSLSETTALYEASRGVAEAATKDELVPALMDQLQSLNPSQIYLLFREGQDEDELRTAVVGMTPQDDSTAFNDDPAMLPIPPAVLMPQDVLIAEKIAHPSISEADMQVLQSVNVGAIASYPLIARGERIIGWFVLAYDSAHHFSSEERRFLSTLASQAAVAIDVLRLFESTQAAFRALSKLYQGNRRTTEARTSFEAAEIVREELLSFSPNRLDIIVQRGTEDFETLETLMAWTNERSLEDIPALPLDPVSLESRADYNLLEEAPIFIENIDSEAFTQLHRSLRAIDTTYRAVLSTPLRVSGRTIGRLAMGFLQPRTFNNDDRRFVEILSDSLAYVVSNEQLFSQTQDSLEETGVLYQASRAIANAEVREDVLQAMIDYAASANVDKVMLITLISEDWYSPNALVEVTTTWGKGDFLDLRGLRFTPVQLPIWDRLSSEEITWSDNIDEDDSIDEFTKLGFRTLDISSFVVVPLRTTNRAVGAIMLGSSTPRQHTDREIRIYGSLADQASITLENKTLLDQADIRTRQLEISAQVSQSATQILNLDELFPKIVEQIKESFSYDHAQIFIIDDLGEHAVLRSATGEAGRQMLAARHSLPVGSPSVVGQATSTGQAFLVSDTSEQGVMHRPNPFLPDTRAELAIPLRVKGAIVGAIDVQSNQPGAFNNDDISALTSLADQLAIAFDNARLFEVSQQRANDMSFLFDVTSTAASATGGLGETLETLATVLIRQMRGLAVEIFLLSQKSVDELESQVLIVARESEESLEYHFEETGSNIPLGKGLVGWVGRHMRPIIIADFDQEKEYLPTINGSRSGIFVPLMAANNLVGVVAIEGARPYMYDNEDLQLMMTLSSTLTPIIQNVLLVDELQETNERLREIDELKTNFLASMSHELRTPLNSIIGFSRVILKGIDGPITDMQQQDMQTIHDSGKHLLALVNDILDQAKIEAGRMELVKEYFDAVKMVKSIMSTAQGLTKDKPIDLFLEIGDDLPNAFGDEFRSRQIVLNVVGNAVKYTDEGSITVSVYIDKYERTGRDMMVVSVTDTGIGISEEDLPTVFDQFHQLDSSTTRKAEGTGLGLPLANSFAELQGGGIEVESTLNVGSTFMVYIPIEPIVEEVEDEPEAIISNDADGASLQTAPLGAVVVDGDRDETLPKRPATQELRRRVILVIDDEVGTINLYRRYLSKEGWQVIGETDSTRTEEMIVAHSPQLIILDINMPKREGWDVLENIRKQADAKDIPVIVCSVETNTQRSQSLGANMHIVKPIAEETLVDAVKAIEKEHLSS